LNSRSFNCRELVKDIDRPVSNYLVHLSSYCFVDKDLAVSTLRGELDKAELLGKTDRCYVVVYERFGPHLKTPTWIESDYY
jgi:hypothetical protein